MQHTIDVAMLPARVVPLHSASAAGHRHVMDILLGRSLEVLSDLLAQCQWLQDLYMLTPAENPAYDLG